MSHLKNEEIFLLRDYIYEKTGMYFPGSKRYFFERRFARRLQELNIDSYSTYLQFLQNENGGAQEFGRLIQEITINETSFFRNASQFKAMVNLMIPEIMNNKKKQGENRLRIWSAGCSSGEETYTIALFLTEKYGEKLGKWQVEILGTDIDPAVIETAKTGVYAEYRLRNVPTDIRNRFFTSTRSGFAVTEDIKRMVGFRVSNLNDNRDMIMMRNFDIIFCRNVLIYFNAASKKRVVENFYKSLLPHGFLILGHSESLFGVTKNFKLIHFPGGMAHKKVTE